MGFSVSIAVGLIFIIIIASSIIVIDALSAASDQLEDAKKLHEEIEGGKLQTRITIQSISVSGDPSDYSVTIRIKNEGSTTLDPLKLNVLIDGSLKSFTVTPSTSWFPEKEVTVSVTNLSGSGTHRVKVVTENGISDYETYSV